MEHTLIKERKYNGRYVAMKNFGDNTIIADGKNPHEVYEKAVQRGCSVPVVVYIPIKGMVQIY